MSANMEVQNPETSVAQVSKKRKRTGKERAERKAAAILAREQAEAAVARGGIIEDVTSTAAEASDSVVQEKPLVDLVDLSLLAKRVPTALKHLHPTFKQARSFEVRRLVKKVKFLRTKPTSAEEVKDLEAQLALLTHLALDPIIKSHLLLKLRKHPRTKHVELPAEVVQALTVAPSASSSTSAPLFSKVENRLCSSKVVADVIKPTVAWVTGEEGARLPSKTGPAPRASQTAEKDQERPSSSKPVKSGLALANGDTGENESDNESGDEADGVIEPRMQVVGSDEELEGEFDEEDEAADAAGWESGSVSDGLAGGEVVSDSDDENDDGDSDAVSLPPAPKGKRQREISPPAKKKPKSAATTAVTSSMFLPSLSTGFTLGDSDSDPDLDDDIDGAGVIGNKTVRKNRRGQRARQAIWEKKYGRGAKHVVKAREEEQKVLQAKAERQAKRAERLGVDPAALRGRGRGRGRGGVSFGSRGGSQHFGPQVHADGGVNANSIPVTERRPMASALAPTAAAQTEQKTLHPSWEAAKLRKQKEISSAPKATKIVFD